MSRDAAIVNRDILEAERNEEGGAEDLFSPENPLSVYNLMPVRLREKMEELPQDVLWASARELEKKHQSPITETDQLLRHAFWIEYDLAVKKKRTLIVENIVRGICTKQGFYWILNQEPERFAYIIKPPENYRVLMEELLTLGMRSLRAIVTADIFTQDKYGNQITDAKLAAVQLKTVEMIQNRLQGMPVHRSMQVTENVNRNYNHNSQEGSGSTPDFTQIHDIGTLEKMVNQLESGVQDAGSIEVSFTDERIKEKS